MDGLIVRRVKFRADFMLPQLNVHVEYRGLAYTERRYALRMNHKIEYCCRHNLQLISIYPNDIPNHTCFSEKGCCWA